MGKIGIHLNDTVSTPIQRPMKAHDIRGAQSHFAGPVDDKNATRILLLQAVGDAPRAIGGIVVNNENLRFFKGKLQQLLYERSYVRRLVIRREDDNDFHSAAIIASTG